MAVTQTRSEVLPIRFLALENASGSEIHMRICVVYGSQNVITKSTVTQQVQRFKAG